jgi:hypothetical protein
LLPILLRLMLLNPHPLLLLLQASAAADRHLLAVGLLLLHWQPAPLAVKLCWC